MYYTPEYYELYEKYGDGKALCFVYEKANKIALYPFLINRINDLGYELDNEYYDIQGAYGYNGIVYSSDSQDFINSFYDEFNKFCEGNNIIAEFTRFNPLLKNSNFSERHLTTHYSRQTVYIDLSKNYEQLLNGYSPPCKRNIKAANKNKFKVSIYDKQYPYRKDFINLYQETMKRLDSEPYLFFNDNYFQDLFKYNPLIQIVIFKEDLPIASAIFLCKDNYLHYHLGASDSEYLIFRPNNLIFDEIIKYGIKQGFKLIHLGGGKSSAKNDSLFRFKKGFSDSISEFHIGHKIYNEAVYKKVLSIWGEKYPNLVSKYSNIILRYRFLD
ncbi:MAG: peptidoglycan bridge formation glycyltransferase FemA/FemB family protein [Ignavibacterium sp.]|nr:peptidoglycan bridge formation glycyltransferase FemA/FemB family protein [Ignavibacterium sp.]